MTYIGIIEWSKPRHNITEHSIIAEDTDEAVRYFKDIASEGYGELICVQAIVRVYTRPLGA